MAKRVTGKSAKQEAKDFQEDPPKPRRRGKSAAEAADEERPAHLRNWPEPKEIKGYADDIAGWLAKLDQYKATVMGRVNGIYDKAAERGVTKKLLKSSVKELRDEEKKAKAFAKLTADEKAERKLIREALGLFADTPLGQAALQASGEGSDLAEQAPAGSA